MSWKKNALSYLMWLVYTVLTGVILIGVCDTFCAQYWISSYWIIPMAVLYTAIVCGIVVLLHLFSVRFAVTAGKKREHMLILEALVAIAFLAAGIILRIDGMSAVTQSSDYFEMAKVVEGQRIPQTVHGAVYFYVQILHIVFMLLGNIFMEGIWVQAVLQLAASVIFYFTVRKLSGSVASLVFFGFCMCAPYMVHNSLVLSPEVLYFFLISIAVSLMTIRISVNRLRPVGFLFMGILSAFCFYLDIAGVLLLLLAAGIAFSRGEEDQDRVKGILAVIFCLMGAVLGFACCIFLDSYFSGKTIQGVALAWLRLYQAEEFSLPVRVVRMRWIPLENVVLAGLMVFGIFSFWCDKKGEKISLYTLMACTVIAACCFGIFTEEMSGDYWLYLIFAVLAGTGVEQCFHAVYADRSAGELTEEDKTGEASTEKRKKESEMEKSRKDLPEQTVKEEFPKDLPENQKQEESRKDFPEETEEEPRKVLPEDSGKEEIREDLPEEVKKEFRKNLMEKSGEEPRKGSSEGTKKEEFRKKMSEESGREKFDDIVIINLSEPEEPKEKKQVQYIENPLPLPKKHVKRKMDYSLQTVSGKDDFDYPVAEDDDFDI